MTMILDGRDERVAKAAAKALNPGLIFPATDTRVQSAASKACDETR
jgi:hypothetical protein